MRSRAGTRAAFTLAALFFAAAPPRTAASQRATGAVAPSEADWSGYDRSLAGDRHSPLRQITIANVARWRGRTGNAIGGGVISYALRGRRLVATAAGMNGPTWPVKAQSARIVVYGLP